VVKKHVDWMLKNWPQSKKTFVLQLWPPANVRKLTRAHARGAWLKSRRAYNVRELRHAAWLNSRKGIFGNHVGRECFVLGEEQNSFLCAKNYAKNAQYAAGSRRCTSPIFNEHISYHCATSLTIDSRSFYISRFIHSKSIFFVVCLNLNLILKFWFIPFSLGFLSYIK